jgi:hypothetical protein
LQNGADVLAIMVVTDFLVNSKYSAYIIVTRDNFGRSLSVLAETEGARSSFVSLADACEKVLVGKSDQWHK